MGFLKKFEKIFSAAAFAEAGEFETARQMMKEDDEGIKKERKPVEEKRERPGHATKPSHART
jgi:hypothetical protein